MNIQDWFPLGLTGLISCSPTDSQESSPAPQFKGINSLALSLFIVQLSHLYMTTGKTIALTIQTFVSKVMSLLFNMLFFIAFLPRSMCLLISWLQSLSTVILEPKIGWAKKYVQVFPQDVTENPKRTFDQFNITFLFYFIFWKLVPVPFCLVL